MGDTTGEIGAGDEVAGTKRMNGLSRGRLLLLVGGVLLLVALLVLGGGLLPLALVRQLVPLDAGGLRHVRHAHARLREARPVVLEPEEVGGHRALRSVRVLK
jgi:hypothetical protein